MNNRTRWLAAGAALALVASIGWALGAAPITWNLKGSEIVNLALPGGGSSNPVPAYVMRSGSNHQLIAGGTTVTTQIAAQAEEVLTEGAITTWNVNFPTAPYLGQKVIINCPGGTVSTLVLAATLPAGVTLIGTNPTSCTSGGAASNGSAWTYSLTDNAWYRYL